MKNKSFISYYSLIAAIVAASPATAGVRVGNLSRNYADSYGQVNNLRMGTVAGASAADVQTNVAQTTGLSSGTVGVTTGVDRSGTVIELPIPIANPDLAKRIALGEKVGSVNMSSLDYCSRIYPDGEFAWDTPTAGVGRGGAQTCVAVVELKMVSANGEGNNVVLARVKVAADDAIRCNIDDFPEYSHVANMEVTLPADHEPTMEEVVRQMNKEQKQNAGLKIAAGALIGGIGGNIAGKAERGSDSLFGTGKDKMQTTAGGALLGAAIMAGNSYAGKVGGDVILSTGVNAAAGGVMGNMMASGDSVLRIEDCDLAGGSCLWGYVSKVSPFTLGLSEDGKTETKAYYNPSTGDIVVCNQGEGKKGCKSASRELDVQSVRLQNKPDMQLYEWKNNFSSINDSYCYDSNTNEMTAVCPDGQKYYVVSSVNKIEGDVVHAMIPGVADKTFGFKYDDWYKWRDQHPNVQIYGRNAAGESTGVLTGYSIGGFRPISIEAGDGGLIDISNKARLKSTLTGAGIGGAMGGFVGYQGAQSDINQRWVSAVQEYKDSLTKFYCTTGKRYLGAYNDLIKIPPLNVPEE